VPSRGKSVARGYGEAHRRLRVKLAQIVAAGKAVCSRCGGWIAPDEPWDLDHSDDGRATTAPRTRPATEGRPAAGARGPTLIRRRTDRRTASRGRALVLSAGEAEGGTLLSLSDFRVKCGISATYLPPFPDVPHTTFATCSVGSSSEKTILDAARQGRCASSPLCRESPLLRSFGNYAQR
jgi:hypothetical protein